MDTDQITSVRVRGFEIRDEAARYRIYVTIKQLNGDTHEVAGAQQRWSKIITFSQSLTKQFGKDIVPVLSRPKRFLMKSKFDITHLEERAKSFDTFLKGLLAVVELRNTEEVTNFLSVEVADTKKGKNRSNSVTEPNSAARTVLADQTFEDIKVGAKETEEKSIHVSSQDVTIVYEFTTAVKDIGLIVTFRPDAGNASTQEVVPFERHKSHQTPVLQYYKCPCPGTLTLIFDNSYSRMRAKKVSYRFVLTSTQALAWLLDDDDDGARHPATDNTDATKSNKDDSNSKSNSKINDTTATTQQQRHKRHSTGRVTINSDSFHSKNSKNSDRNRTFKKQRAASRSLSPMGRMSLGKHTSTGKPSPFGQGSANDRLLKASGALVELESKKKEIVELRAELKSTKKQCENFKASLEDATITSQRNEEQVKAMQQRVTETEASRVESERENREQFKARASLEKERSTLENQCSDFKIQNQEMRTKIKFLSSESKTSSEDALKRTMALEKENIQLRERLETTIKPLENQLREAVQIREQSEAEIHTTKNMMQRYQKEAIEMKPKINKLQSKVDKYKAQKTVLVKAVEELREAKLELETKLQTSEDHSQTQDATISKKTNELSLLLKEKLNLNEKIKEEEKKTTEAMSHIQQAKEQHGKDIAATLNLKNQLQNLTHNHSAATQIKGQLQFKLEQATATFKDREMKANQKFNDELQVLKKKKDETLALMQQRHQQEQEKERKKHSNALQDERKRAERLLTQVKKVSATERSVVEGNRIQAEKRIEELRRVGENMRESHAKEWEDARGQAENQMNQLVEEKDALHIRVHALMQQLKDSELKVLEANKTLATVVKELKTTTSAESAESGESTTLTAETEVGTTKAATETAGETKTKQTSVTEEISEIEIEKVTTTVNQNETPKDTKQIVVQQTSTTQQETPSTAPSTTTTTATTTTTTSTTPIPATTKQSATATNTNLPTTNNKMSSSPTNPGLLSMFKRTPTSSFNGSPRSSTSSTGSNTKNNNNNNNNTTISTPPSAPTASPTVASVAASASSVAASASSMFGGFMSRMTAASTPTPQEKRAPKTIDWGLLAEPEVQSLIRDKICNSEKAKINVMYNWLGHVLDGQPRSVLPSKGVEMKRIPMLVCGVFLDRVVPFLNSQCHTDCVVEAYYVEAIDGQKADWKFGSRMWIPEKVEETPRQRAGTLDVLMNGIGGTDGTDGKEISTENKWQRRFSLKDDQHLSSVHIRIGLEMKLK